jgi:folate-binding protein YgfZ
MSAISPLGKLHRQADATFAAYPPTGSVHGGDSAPTEMVATFGDVDAEYEAIRHGVGLLDLPAQTSLTATGANRDEFFNRLVTQQITPGDEWHSTPAFLLDRTGRIAADLRMVQLPDRTIVSLDAAVATAAMQTLERYIIADDVELRDDSEVSHRLALLGPASPSLLTAVSKPIVGAPLDDLTTGSVALVEIAGAEVVVDRADTIGSMSLELFVPTDTVLDVYQQLLEAGHARADGDSTSFCAVGWTACNMARVECGAPAYLIDFGARSLPHETGMLDQRVSFTKGCYLGQEIVARTQALGKPKQQLVALKFESGDPPALGIDLFPAISENNTSVGVVTSSIASPQFDGLPYCFAQVKTSHIEIGEPLRTSAGAVAEIQSTLSIKLD